MAKSAFVCARCGQETLREVGAINRAIRSGLALYCTRECAGIARQCGKTKEQKLAEKAEYDSRYRAKNSELIKEKKAAHFRETYDPEKARAERKKRMPYHVEYCRRPEYVEKKKSYDLDRRAKEYGPFSESYKILLKIQKEVLSKSSRYEIDTINGKLNKAHRRKNADGTAYRN